MGPPLTGLEINNFRYNNIKKNKIPKSRFNKGGVRLVHGKY